MDNQNGNRSPWPVAHGPAGRRVDHLRDSAVSRREQAETYYALARATRMTEDRIVYEEFARRSLESARRIESPHGNSSRR